VQSGALRRCLYVKIIVVTLVVESLPADVAHDEVDRRVFAPLGIRFRCAGTRAFGAAVQDAVGHAVDFAEQRAAAVAVA